MKVLAKTITQCLCLPQFCVGVGNNFEGPFASESRTCCHPRFRRSVSELTPESRKELDVTATGFVAVQRLKISQLWCPRKRTFVKMLGSELCKMAHGMSVQGASHFTVKFNIKS